MDEKSKELGEIKRTGKIISNAVQILDGDTRYKNARVPIILIDYLPPKSAHSFASGETFKFWIKFEEAEFRAMEKQFKKGLREISIWFDKKDRDKLRDWLVNDKQKKLF